jgi:exodeoxyribonuclease VII small subunit
MAEETPSQAIAEMSFEAALEELETIVRQLEDGKSALDDAISAYQRGAALKKHCQAKLRQAQMKVDKIVLGDDGKVGLEPAPGLSE